MSSIQSVEQFGDRKVNTIPSSSSSNSNDNSSNSSTMILQGKLIEK